MQRLRLERRQYRRPVSSGAPAASGGAHFDAGAPAHRPVAPGPRQEVSRYDKHNAGPGVHSSRLFSLVPGNGLSIKKLRHWPLHRNRGKTMRVPSHGDPVEREITCRNKVHRMVGFAGSPLAGGLRSGIARKRALLPAPDQWHLPFKRTWIAIRTEIHAHPARSELDRPERVGSIRPPFRQTAERHLLQK